MATADPSPITQQEFDKLITNYFANSSIDLHHIEQPYFKNVFSVFNIDKLELEIMKQPSLENRIREYYTKVRAHTKTALQSVDNVCVNAEHISNFLVITCYWIGPELTRQSHTLDCQTSHFPYLNFKDCNEHFFNQVIGVRHYKKFFGQEEQISKRDYYYFLSDGVVVLNDVNASCRSYAQLCTETIDIYICNKSLLRNIISRWQIIKDAADRKPKVVKKILGRYFIRNDHRYRYYDYYTCLHLLSIEGKHKELQTALDIKRPLLDEDFVFINEYVNFCKMFVDAADALEDDGQLFYGVTLPCLLSLRKKLIRHSNNEYVHCEARKCLELFEEEFAEFLQLATDSALNAAIAAISYPKFKDRWLSCIDSEYHGKIRDVFKGAVIEAIDNIGQLDMQAEYSDDEFFDFDNGREDYSYKAEILIARYLADSDSNVCMLHRHREVKHVFVKYNTPLSIKPVDIKEFVYNMRNYFTTEAGDLVQKIVLRKRSVNV